MYYKNNNIIIIDHRVSRAEHYSGRIGRVHPSYNVHRRRGQCRVPCPPGRRRWRRSRSRRLISTIIINTCMKIIDRFLGSNWQSHARENWLTVGLHDDVFLQTTHRFLSTFSSLRNGSQICLLLYFKLFELKLNYIHSILFLPTSRYIDVLQFW